MFRIVNPYKNNTNKKVVFIQHGFVGSSDHWVINSEGGLDVNHNYIENGGEIINHCNPDDSKPAANTLGFVLADCGYDVWLGNSRGNSYSNKHLTLNPYTPIGIISNQSILALIIIILKGDFWKFSFQQMGKYDIPAVIDYILNATKRGLFNHHLSQKNGQ